VLFRSFALARGAAWQAITAGGRSLFTKIQPAATCREYVHAGILALFFLGLFRLLSTRALGAISGQADQHYHQAFIDYDIDWSTPVFALAGNLLNNFGIQVPFNGNAAPMLRLAHALAPAREFEIAHALFFLADAALLWIIGRAFGLRPVARVIVAGTAALIATIPTGLDRIVYVLPPNLLTHLLILGLWWFETSLYCLAAGLCFFFLGQGRGMPANLLLGAGFALGSILLLLAFPAGAAFGVALIALYCAAFLITSRTGAELFWKLATGAVLATVLVVLRVPSFFLDLYGYTYSSHFHESVPVHFWQYFRELGFISDVMSSSLPGSLGSYDLRLLFVWAACFLTACALAFAAKNVLLRRFAFAVLFVEIGMPVLSVINSLTAQQRISFNYAEMFQAPFLFWFFAALCAMLLFAFDRALVLYLCNGMPAGSIARGRWLLARYRLGLYLVFVALLVSPYLIGEPRIQHAFFPARETASIELLKNTVRLEPGAAFRGRVLVLAGTRAAPGDQWLGGALGTFDTLNLHYLQILGNDHYIDLLGLGIPDAAEYGHWTSPVTFTFLRAFFGNPEDHVLKAFFPLRVFNTTIARLMGVRMIVTDAQQLPDARLVYETQAGDAPLRIFELDDINLGQYSPVRPRVAGTALEMLRMLGQASFDPQTDVLTEGDIPTALVPATDVSVMTDLGPALRVRATSRGWSLLVLPFEYSACLRLGTNANGTARLVPVNLQQTGLLFQGKMNVSISYRFGPFDQPQCRRRDMERVDRLRLRAPGLCSSAKLPSPNKVCGG